MTIENKVRVLAGSNILASLLLAHTHSPKWLWFTAFVGANLIQSAFTGFCPVTRLMKDGSKKDCCGG